MDWNEFHNHISGYVAANITEYDEEKASDVMTAAYLDGWMNHCGFQMKGEPHNWNNEKSSLLRE